MRVLLFTIGSRGEVQPLAALASELRRLGQGVRVCAPPDFRERIESSGIQFVPVGPELRGTASARAAGRTPPTPAQRRQALEGTVAAQFAALRTAAEGCDAVVAGGALSIAPRTVAEQAGVPYVYASFCPRTLPSPHHPPLPLWGQAPARSGAGNRALWAEDARRWNEGLADVLNAHRGSAGLEPVADVRSHMFTGRPWLAADPVLGPWPGPADSGVLQTGAWTLPDESPLAPELETFLDAGEPPVYFGFGSIRAPEGAGRTMVEAARALGRRSVVARGWTGLSLPDGAPDCLSVGEVNQQALFRRVAAVVHHGGAGTTTAAAGAGAPQAVLPQFYDQPYWARRVQDLGIGAAHPCGEPTARSLTLALEQALQPDVAARARVVAAGMHADGAAVAARGVMRLCS